MRRQSTKEIKRRIDEEQKQIKQLKKQFIEQQKGCGSLTNHINLKMT